MYWVRHMQATFHRRHTYCTRTTIHSSNCGYISAAQNSRQNNGCPVRTHDFRSLKPVCVGLGGRRREVSKGRSFLGIRKNKKKGKGKRKYQRKNEVLDPQPWTGNGGSIRPALGRIHDLTHLPAQPIAATSFFFEKLHLLRRLLTSATCKPRSMSASTTTSPPPTSTTTGSAPNKNSLFLPTSANADPLWVSGPNIRSTFDLVSSCVLTLILCVYTAIHLNIPRFDNRIRKNRWWVQCYTRLWWMFLGLIAPETVLYAAWTQYIQARRVVRALERVQEGWESEGQNAAGADSTIDPHSECYDDTDLESQYTSSSKLLNPTGTKPPGLWKRFKEWFFPAELERGFYVSMGGFEVVVDRGPEGRDIRRTVTPSGAVLLARLGLLPPITIEVIRDKSKADILTKFLVCVQASWMIVQAIARKINHLPVTLLELNTVMHVVCALMMYLLWLKKPQDVGIPTRIDDRTREKRLGVLLSVRKIYDSAPVISENRYHFPVLEWHAELGLFKWKKPDAEDEDESDFNVWEAKEGTALPKVRVHQLWIQNSTTKKATYLEFGPETFLSLPQAQFLVDYCLGQVATFGKSTAHVDWNVFTQEIQGNGSFGCTKQAGNFELVGKIRSADSNAGLIAAVVFPAVYGGVHLTPWDAHFPTVLERYLWRFSGLSIMIGIPTFTMLFAICDWIFDTANPFKMPWQAFKLVMKLRPSGFWKNVVLTPLLFVFALGIMIVSFAFGNGLFVLVALYPLTRIYLLVEAFASLRSLPVGSYKTVEWTDMWPHW